MENTSLVLGSNHNGINCIQNTSAERSCDKVWFTAKQIEEWSGMSKGTLRNRLIDLGECGRISPDQDFNQVNIPTETGAAKSTIYNLNVLNQLAMIEMKNKVLNETAKKFSDILSEVETTGSYGIPQLSTEQQLLLKAFEAANDPVAFAAVIKERDEYVHKTELKRSMTAIGKLGGITTARNIAIKERDEAREQLIIRQEELDTVNDLYNELKDTIGEGDKWQSSAQLMQNYPEKFRTFKSPSALTRYLKKRSVEWKLSDHSDKTGFYYAIFDVEQALTTI